MYTVAPTPTPTGDAGTRRRWLGRYLVLSLVGLLAVFWIWALFFASKEAVNKIGDRAWAARAEQVCIEADEARMALTDLRVVADGGPELIRERADIVDHATDILERMVDDLVAVEPTDAKGQAIVPLWEADYRIYLQDRRNFAANLRTTGENQAFYETKVDAIPISERIATFAGDNEMSACAPPFDLSR